MSAMEGSRFRISGWELSVGKLGSWKGGYYESADGRGSSAGRLQSHMADSVRGFCVSGVDFSGAGL